MYGAKRKICSVFLTLGVTLEIGGCSQKPVPASVQGEPQLRPVATIQDLMDGEIDPAADALWDAVAFIATKAGTEDRQPRTEAQWKAVRANALTLVEAANLLSVPGRRVAAADSPTGPGELRPEQIQQRIEAGHGGFVQFARALQDAGLKALTAIDARDATGLMDAGGRIDEACEACHVTYWYPGQNRPGT